jgi:hypothetical protein
VCRACGLPAAAGAGRAHPQGGGGERQAHLQVGTLLPGPGRFSTCFANKEDLNFLGGYYFLKLTDFQSVNQSINQSINR